MTKQVVAACEQRVSGWKRRVWDGCYKEVGEMFPALNVGGVVCVNMSNHIKLHSLNMYSLLRAITPQ